MGFQPEGDLPEGIIVPPPVIGNATEDYDYDDGSDDATSSSRFVDIDASQVRVENRARGGALPPSRRPPPSQNRGQTIEPPVTERPRSRFEPQAAFQPTPRRPEAALQRATSTTTHPEATGGCSGSIHGFPDQFRSNSTHSCGCSTKASRPGAYSGPSSPSETPRATAVIAKRSSSQTTTK